MGKQTPLSAGPICHLTTDSIEDELEDENRILRLYLKGDSGAFWRLWELYRGFLFGICLKQMGGVREDAEDALSLAMLKAWDRLPEHASKIINIKAWLTRMTCNLCVDLHRERRRRVKNIERIEDMSAADHLAVAVAIESPEQRVLHREMNICVQRAFNDLPPRLRAPMMLHSFQAMPYRDIAEQLMLTNENVRKRIQHARVFLHERLKLYRSGMTDSESRDFNARGAIRRRAGIGCAPGHSEALPAITTS